MKKILLSLMLLSFFSLESELVFGQYCYPPTSSTCCMGIYQVTFNTINNYSGTANYVYSDYTAQSTNVTQGNSYTLSVYGWSYGQYVTAWIDYNNNSTFEASEIITSWLYVPANSFGSVSITIPAAAAVGAHRMRIRSEYSPYNTPSDPCIAVTYGESEDYTVNVVSSCTTPGTPTAITGTATGQTTDNLSWAAGSPAGSTTVTYYWFVSTNPSGVCGTTTTTFNYSGSIVNWTVPAGVTSVTIDAYGAQGGTNLWGYAGGLGARAKGTISVTPGQVLKILVGGQGGGGGSAYTGGGGGGSFVTDASNTPKIIAGGGGGAQYYAYTCASANKTGSASTTANAGIFDPIDADGDGIYCTSACGGGAGPAGGGAACMSTLASAGGGGLTG